MWSLYLCLGLKVVPRSLLLGLGIFYVALCRFLDPLGIFDFEGPFLLRRALVNAVDCRATDDNHHGRVQAPQAAGRCVERR